MSHIDAKLKAEIAKDLAKDEGPTKCTWHLGDKTQKSPHHHEPSKPEPKILDSILDHIGNTPLVRINNITKDEGIECEILAKCEFFNAGGSVKDRIGKRMILDAEAAGRIKPGDTLIEPTSGNTGIGMSLTAALRGYKMVITLPEKMSQEKVDVLKALGAEIIRTPTEAAFDSPDSHIGVAKRLNDEIPRSHILDQYANPSNPLAHYDGTAVELIEQTGGKIDVAVIGAGTGGTISGIARRLKEHNPNIKIYGVDPYGSILALPETLNSTIVGYQVEGIGYDFIPTVLDRELIDEWIKTEDKEAFVMARRLIKQEGLLCGGSSGTAMAAAIKVAKKMKKGERLVVVLPDSVRNYMSKFLNDKWMVEYGFLEPDQADIGPEEWWHSQNVSVLKLGAPLTVNPTITCEKVAAIMQKEAFDQLPVVAENGECVGVITTGNLTAKLLSGRVKAKDPVSQVMYKQYKQVSLDTSLSTLSKIFDHDHFAVVTTTQRSLSAEGDEIVRKVVFGVVTRVDLLDYVIKNGGDISRGNSFVAGQ